MATTEPKTGEPKTSGILTHLCGDIDRVLLDRVLEYCGLGGAYDQSRERSTVERYGSNTFVVLRDPLDRVLVVFAASLEVGELPRGLGDAGFSIVFRLRLSEVEKRDWPEDRARTHVRKMYEPGPRDIPGNDIEGDLLLARTRLDQLEREVELLTAARVERDRAIIERDAARDGYAALAAAFDKLRAEMTEARAILLHGAPAGHPDGLAAIATMVMDRLRQHRARVAAEAPPAPTPPRNPYAADVVDRMLADGPEHGIDDHNLAVLLLEIVGSPDEWVVGNRMFVGWSPEQIRRVFRALLEAAPAENADDIVSAAATGIVWHRKVLADSGPRCWRHPSDEPTAGAAEGK
jgi:hypothetical protein